MRLQVWLAVILCLVKSLSGCLNSSKKDITRGINVCPTSHPYAIKQGDVCCKFLCADNWCHDEDSADGPCNSLFEDKTVSWATNVCPGGNSTLCPEGSQCEDRVPRCTATYGKVTIIVDGFGHNWDGEYTHNKGEGIHNYEGNRAVFDREDKCIWWHRLYRHWWLGECKFVGSNSGHAFLVPDQDCPYSRESTDQWTRPNSQIVKGGSMIQDVACSGVVGSATHETSATGAISSIELSSSSNRVTLRCNWKKVNGRWRCIRY